MAQPRLHKIFVAVYPSRQRAFIIGMRETPRWTHACEHLVRARTDAEAVAHALDECLDTPGGCPVQRGEQALLDKIFGKDSTVWPPLSASKQGRRRVRRGV